MMRNLLIGLVVTSSSLFSASAFQQHHRPAFGTTKHHRRPSLSWLNMGGKSSNAGRLPKNEFSRTVPPDVVLKLHERQRRNSAAQRQYTVDIEAAQDERVALAERFQLKEVSRLESSLSLRPEGHSAVDSANGIVVEGTVLASVTQTCVRTNEDFQVNLEFPLFSVVRPVEGVGVVTSPVDDKSSAVKMQRGGRSNHRKGSDNNEAGAKDTDAGDDIDPTEMLKIQSMLEDMEQQEVMFDDFLMEDEAIYACNGMLDVGELVSQVFWLQLDPYPKKPGTSLSSFSISG